MPVPSTMMGFRLTKVLILCARVASAHAFIMMGGPIATHSAMSGWRATAAYMTLVTGPLMPTDPSSVHTYSSSHTDLNLSSQNIRSLFRKPTTPMT